MPKDKLTDEEIRANATAMVEAEEAKENSYEDEPDATLSKAMGQRTISLSISSNRTQINGKWKRIIAADVSGSNHIKQTDDYSALFTSPILAFIWAAKRLVELMNKQYRAEWSEDVPDKMEFDMRTLPIEPVETNEDGQN